MLDKTAAEREISEMSDILDTNQDASDFYASAQNQVQNTQMQSTFKELESLHRSTVTNIKEAMRSRGAKPEQLETKESVGGKMSRMFGEIKAKMADQTDDSLIKSLEEAEDKCLHAIQDLMKNEKVSQELKNTLQAEYDRLRKSHDHMKALKQRVTAA